MEYNEKASLKALIYSSIFEYPLTEKELWQFAISEKVLHKQSFFSALSQSSYISKKQEFYFIKNEKQIVTIRLSREKIAAKKLRIARRISAVLSKIPMILFIGLSGSLSMANTKEGDDIDLFIVTKQHSVWITRCCMLLILEFLGKRRKKNATEVSDKICINLLIEESHLSFPSLERNLYTAHEVAQVKPLFNRNHTYEKFLIANTWVKKFLPNAVNIPELQNTTLSKTTYMITLLNFLAKLGQLWYMKRHRTSEIITDTVVSFYTNKTKQYVLEAYQKKIKTYAI
ncbi:MAG TPA: hypothetical protein VLF89_09860 [Candidatus Saccharimonadales bacterium]|nr:hypothetical protein [Candidatus Saccharimonadales bacterium]